jgi:hypothetical protein
MDILLMQFDCILRFLEMIGYRSAHYWPTNWNTLLIYEIFFIQRKWAILRCCRIFLKRILICLLDNTFSSFSSSHSVHIMNDREKIFFFFYFVLGSTSQYVERYIERINVLSFTNRKFEKNLNAIQFITTHRI